YRNTLYVPKGGNLEDDKAILLKHGVKRHKLQQDHRGVAYTPNFDFDLFAPQGELLVEFRWKNRMTKNQYQISRQATFTVIKIKGNGRGSAGLGFGRAGNYEEATRKADILAATHMISIPRYLNHTISHTLVGKMHNLRCIIEPKPVGYGERGPPFVKAVCHCFGIRDYNAR
ncbi:28S ribosomal protein S5, mitochondrial, partial [Reticulomyxa filosa]